MQQFILKYSVIQCKGTKIDLSVMFLFIEHNALDTFSKSFTFEKCWNTYIAIAQYMQILTVVFNATLSNTFSFTVVVIFLMEEEARVRGETTNLPQITNKL
jgi:hypothetical protein